jgi:hypothetical protein
MSEYNQAVNELVEFLTGVIIQSVTKNSKITLTELCQCCNQELSLLDLSDLLPVELSESFVIWVCDTAKLRWQGKDE